MDKFAACVFDYGADIASCSPLPDSCDHLRFYNLSEQKHVPREDFDNPSRGTDCSDRHSGGLALPLLQTEPKGGAVYEPCA